MPAGFSASPNCVLARVARRRTVDTSSYCESARCVSIPPSSAAVRPYEGDISFLRLTSALCGCEVVVLSLETALDELTGRRPREVRVEHDPARNLEARQRFSCVRENFFG